MAGKNTDITQMQNPAPRSITVFLMFLGGLMIILCKILIIQFKEGPELRSTSLSWTLRADSLYARRGNIYTEEGALLSTSVRVYDIHVDFSVIRLDTFARWVDSLSTCMSTLFKDKSPAIYKEDFLNAYHDSAKYYTIGKGLSYAQYKTIKHLPLFRTRPRLSGLLVEAITRRERPFGLLAYRSIGLNREWYNYGRSVGLEASHDSVLRGEVGSDIAERYADVWLPVRGSETAVMHGSDIITTLDIRIQKISEGALLSVLQQYKCLHGSCIVMETKTGKIKALVNLGTTIDSNTYRESENFALQCSEPGQTFELATLLALLNDGYINVDDMVDAQGGVIQFGNRTMRDSHLGIGVLSIKDAFAHSSNVAFSKLAYLYYYKNPERFINRLEELGVDRRSGIDLAGESRPNILKPGSRDWNSTTLPWMATGYGVQITPMKLCMLYNGVANEGRMMRPYLVSAIRRYGQDVRTIKPEVVATLGSKEGIDQAKRCLRNVVQNGTGKNIDNPVYAIAGKTGTATVADKIEGKFYGYSAGFYDGSFVGYFPADSPRYTICVVLRTKPHSGAYYGGATAAPVFRMISDALYRDTTFHLRDPNRPVDPRLNDVNKNTKWVEAILNNR